MSERGLFLNLAFSFEREGWYASIVDDLERLVHALPMWSQWKTLKATGTKPTKLTEASLADALRASGGRIVELVVGREGEVALECSHFEDVLLLRLEVYDGAWLAFADQLETIAWSFIDALRAGLVLPISGIMPRFIPDLPWDELSNRPNTVAVRYENVVDFFDRRLVELWKDLDSGPAIARIVDAPMSAGMRRIERSGVVMVSFTDALTDQTALATARMQHERWLVERMRAARPAGDRLLSVSEQVEAPPLSFVDPESRLGFKTVVVFPDGSRQNDAWDAAAEVAHAGAIEPFGKLAGVYIIVPLREHAVAWYQRAQEAGFTGISYPDHRGGLWVVSASK